MNISKNHSPLLRMLWPTLAGMLLAPTLGAAPLTLSSTPLFITPTVAPNILVIMDNSQSMDAYMAGTLVSGNNASTRANIGRSVMRDVIASYRSTFNWGLMSYGLTGATPLQDTYAYYLGSDAGMVFTNDCVPAPTLGVDGVYVPGVSASNGNRNCLPNPQPFPGGNYVTYDKAGDDASILDVLYVPANYTAAPQFWAVTSGAGSLAAPNHAYWVYQNHSLLNSWVAPSPACVTGSPASYGDFSPPAPFSECPTTFSYTDAGFLPGNPGNPSVTRQLYLPRVKTSAGQCAYYSDITGFGKLNEAVQVDSTTHYNNLIAKLGSETCDANSNELKDAAVFTPTRGTLISARQYFAGTNGFTSPVSSSSCQKNFTVMVTDGLPTGRTTTTTGSDGNPTLLYSDADRTNTYNASTGTWTFGAAAQDAINAVCSLQSPYVSSTLCTGGVPTNTAADPLPPGDIPVYVLALSDTLQNAGAVAVMNAMASAGGTNSAYFATNPTAFKSAFNSIAADILGRIGAAASVATNSGALISGSRIYQARFTSTTWSGDFLAYPINANNGSIGTTPDWKGGTVSWETGGTSFTQAPSARNIFTYKPSTGQGIPFLWPAVVSAPTGNELDTAQTTALNKNSSGTSDGLGSSRLDYLRGDSSKEGTSAGNFRVRPANKLGDIVDSSPIFVSKPDGGYPATLEGALGSTADYSKFRANNSARTKMLYVGANDGMLHGFNADTGQETMAYVPSKTYANLSSLSAIDYSHKYFVNGSSTVADVFFGSAWHTVLVGSLAQGGQSIFALDITNPANFSQGVTNAQNLVLWEFNDTDNAATVHGTSPSTTPLVDGDPDLGYTLSQPAVGRVCITWTGSTCSASKWVAIFGNGYNNTEADGSASTTGYAYLYVVDIQNGEILSKISTKTGSTTNPNGLASPAFVDVNGDYYIDYVYAGDLQGNMWKFDFTGNASTWKVAYGSTGSPKPLYQAEDASGNSQPITTRPQITTHPSGSGYLVYFGTGKYLEPITDVATTSTQTQTFYGIWDNGAQVPSVTTRNSLILQQQAIDAQTSAARHTTLNSVSSSLSGWYMDLCVNTAGSGSCSSNLGEKQVSNPVLANGRILFTTLLPDSASCYGGSSWLMVLDFASGGRTATSPFDLNNDGTFNNSDTANFGGSVGGAQANGAKLPGIAGAPTAVFNPQNRTSHQFFNPSGNGDPNDPNDPNNPNRQHGIVPLKVDTNLGIGIGRVSWRELLDQ